MKHIDEIEAVAIAEGGGTEAGRAHVRACARCGRWVAGLGEALSAMVRLGEAGDAMAVGLRRWALAYASAATAARPRLSVLGFLAGGMQPLSAVRGGASSGVAVLFGDRNHHVDLRVEPERGGSARLHGQVVTLASAEPRVWQVAVVLADGTVRTTESDGNGEFRLEGLGVWRGMSLLAERDDERLVVARIGDRQATIDDA